MRLFAINNALIANSRNYNYTLENLIKVRDSLSLIPLRTNTYESLLKEENKSLEEYLDLLLEDGRFSDLDESVQSIAVAIRRLTLLACKKYKEKDLPQKVYEALCYYILREVERADKGSTRFHTSIFALPVCAINIFFSQYEIFKKVENGEDKYLKLYNLLARLMLQSWLLPNRNDATDLKPFSVERFQNNVWWEGGNALSYRPTFETSICLLNLPMFQIMLTVMKNAVASTTSIYGSSFWQEGICADGWGWGHGRQCYNNGYPTDSILSILSHLSLLKEECYYSLLSSIDWCHIAYYAKAITFNVYKSFFPPMMSRHCFPLTPKAITANDSHAKKIAKFLVTNFPKYLSSSVLKEMEVLEREGSLALRECKGRRYFFNNDSLVVKTDEVYCYFNCASSRLKGVESADFMADKRNFYTRDGAYLILKDENAYKKAMGTWNVCQLPGTTERSLEKEEIQSETNWQGYHSLFDFAGGLTNGSNAVSGFVYQKSGEREKDGAGKIYPKFTKEMLGVIAQKSLFNHEGLFVFLGSGISDTLPLYGHDVKTTIDNTLLLNKAKLIYQEKEMAVISGFYQDELYIENNGLIYGFPEGKVEVFADNLSTDWAYLNQGNEGCVDEIVPILKLQINHQKNPKNEKYYYWISSSLPLAEAKQSFKVLQRSEKLHAVAFKDCIQAVFFQEEKLETPYGVFQTDSPLIVCLTKTKQGLECQISDPMQVNGKVVTLTLDGKSYSVEMPKAEYCGKNISVVLEDK